MSYTISLANCAVGSLPLGGVWRYRDCNTKIPTRPAGYPLISNTGTGELTINCEAPGNYSFSYVMNEGSTCETCTSITIALVDEPTVNNIPGRYVCRRGNGGNTVVFPLNTNPLIIPMAGYVRRSCNTAQQHPGGYTLQTTLGSIVGTDLSVPLTQSGSCASEVTRSYTLTASVATADCDPTNPNTPDCADSANSFVRESPIYGKYVAADTQACDNCSSVDLRPFFTYDDPAADSNFDCLDNASAPPNTTVTLRVFAPGGGTLYGEISVSGGAPLAGIVSSVNLCGLLPGSGPCYSFEFEYRFTWQGQVCYTGPKVPVTICTQPGAISAESLTVCNDQS